MTRVEEVMTADAPVIGQYCTLVSAAMQMRKLDVDAIAVTGKNGRICGTLTASDIVRCLGEGGDPALTRAGEAIDPSRALASPDDEVAQCLATMRSSQMRCWPVASDGAIVGTLIASDIEKLLSNSAR